MTKTTLFTSKSTLAGMVFGLLAALIWGSWPVLTRLGVEQTLNPYDITALRFAVSGMALLPLLWKRGWHGVGWVGALVMAGGAGVPYVLVMVSGLAFAPASHAGVITPSCMLIFSTLGSWWFLGDKPDPSRLLGLLVILVGVFLIGGQGFVNSNQPTVWLGDLMFVAGGFFWASYTVASKAWSVDSFHATSLVSVISMVLYLPLYLISGQSELWQAPVSEVLFQASFQGLFAAILALLFYTQSVVILGAARGAVFATLVPGIALLLAFPILGEIPTSIELVGVVTVSLGMVYALGFLKKLNLFAYQT